MRAEKSQSMLEYIMVLGIAMFILIPTLYFFFSQSVESSAIIASERLDVIGSEVIDQVNYVSALSEGSRTNIQVSVPEGLQNITVFNNTPPNIPIPPTGYDLILSSLINGEIQEQLYTSYFPMFIGTCPNVTDSFPENFIQNPGRKTFLIESCGTYVAIWYN